MTILKPSEALTLPAGSRVEMYERLGQLVPVQHFIVKGRRGDYLLVGLVADMNRETQFLVTHKTFQQSPGGFALKTDGGTIIVRFRVLDPVETFRQQDQKG